MITIPSAHRSRPSLSLRRCARVAATLAFVMFVTAAVAQVRYNTPDEAVTALIDAAKASDLKALTRVLGPGSADIVSSGDPVADASARKRVVDAYDAKHQVVMEGADKAVLIIGREDWPLPIPLVRKDGAWRVRHRGRPRGNPLSPHRAQRAERDPGLSRLCRRAARICRERHRRQRSLRTAHRQPAGQEGRPLLAGAIRRGREPARRARRQRRGGGVSRRPAAHSLSRLLLQGAHPAGPERARRRARTTSCAAR